MNEKTDTCPDCSNIPCDCGLPAGYTPTPWTDANEEDGWNPCGWAVDSNLVRELERELAAVTEQRDKYRDVASELIAMIRINVMRDTFKIATIEQVDEHLKPWIERISAVKGGSDE